MDLTTHNLHIYTFEPLDSPREIRDSLPITEKAARAVTGGREAVRQAIAGDERRLVVVTGHFDAADDWIVDHVSEHDIVVTPKQPRKRPSCAVGSSRHS